MTELLLLTAVALAQPQPVRPEGHGEMAPLDELVRDLRGEDPRDQLFAARELRRQVRQHSKTVDTGKPDRLSTLESRSALAELDERLVQPCIDALEAPVARHCAQILGMLHADEAQPALESMLLQTELPRRTRRAVDTALQTIRESQQESP